MSARPTVTVSKDGPYLVTGAVPVQMQTITPNAEGTHADGFVDGL